MKIILVGASGTIGQAIDRELRERHDIVRVGRNSGELQVNIADPASIRRLFEQTGPFDALISAAGNAHFGALEELTAKEFAVGLDDKLMGQVNLVLIGREFANDGASFTLTSGVLSEDPIRYGAAVSTVNAALDGFVRAAAIELPRGLRINGVSPTILEESLPAYGPYFRGFKAVPAATVALAYAKSAEGRQTGQVYRVL
ncbi:short chain dehydrogenase [Aquipseudomonas alcaligenes]|uniref:Short chain dehydrogenase n=1 Tax=Aquipseudomonas alcaligenes TaxID=43263 RepID=A0AA37CCL0_AQUAC|nr:short chain dehydrogenase [Pseudomonas alcaligenes]BCR23742.1 short chain dehydrogenase [Pseudomonas alcaligenes]GIZ65193.1 short chain dehydrogenase [Pseudomonas alcaligenes]GIZ69482.1 short chain dehydrogenase [Pseudomonas alcaligenes]GIZ73834.1 short chain dehydrogenase [Pseudomonas alcaligenes]GIZ78195.1 short chain dehydrogenase [Pseudomonas alcaligenes]